MARKKRKKQVLQALAVSTKDQAEYTPPGVDTTEAINSEEISRTLSPTALANLVAQGKKGNGLALTTLALEMREEDASFGGNLRTRKLALLNQPCTIAEGENERANELVQTLIEKRYFNKLLYLLLEAIEVGYAVIRLVWAVDANGHWLPVSVHRIDPRRVGFDPISEGYFWRDFDDPDNRKNQIDGAGLEYIVYTPDDILMPNRGGLCRLAAYAFMAKRFGLNDWVKYLSSAGMPMRVGRYDKGAASEERQILKRALQSLSSDKAAAIPKNTEIDFLEAKSSSGFGFQALAEYLDKQLSVAVLGQTLTSGAEGGGSYNLGVVHENVRLDILRSDCISISAELQELVDKICLVNFGENSAPHISIKPKIKKDLKQLAGVVATLTEGGLAVPKRWIYEEFGIPEPKDGEEVLGSAKDGKEGKDKKTKQNETNSLIDSLNAADSYGLGEPDAELDEINDAALDYDYKPIAENAVISAINSSRSFAQLQKKLAKIALQAPGQALVQALALAATKGALLGQRDGQNQKNA